VARVLVPTLIERTDGELNDCLRYLGIIKFCRQRESAGLQVRRLLPALHPRALSRMARNMASTFSIGVLPWILWMALKT